jgi:hypothetical protein
MQVHFHYVKIASSCFFERSGFDESFESRLLPSRDFVSCNSRCLMGFLGWSASLRTLTRSTWDND